MKRILLSVVAFAALAFGGLTANQAHAQGPYGPYGYGCRPGVGYGSYGAYGRYGFAGGYSPYNVYSQRYAVPYGAGYSGGWQPYQGFYRSGPRPQVGLYFGF